jgi:hypothetical protein
LSVVSSQFSVVREQGIGAKMGGNVQRGTYSFCLVYVDVNHIIISKVLKIKK